MSEKKNILGGLVPEKQREAFAALSIGGKAAYLWHYYWLYLVIILSALALIAGVTASVLSAPKNIRLYIMLDSPAQGEQSALESSVSEYLNSDGSSGSVVSEAVTYNHASPQHLYEQMNVTVKVASDSVDLILCRDELFEFLLSVKGLLPLDAALCGEVTSNGCEVVYARAGSGDPESETPLEANESAYAVKLPDGRLACVAANSRHTADALCALAFIAKGE